ncbi:MAG: ribonuclease P protein component [Bdellovibrionota bacterium]
MNAEPRKRARRGADPRIGSSRDFEKALKGGVRRSGPGFAIVAAPNETGHSRLGFIVGAACGNAVRRNRFRRLARECFRLHPTSFAGAKDFIVIARGRIQPRPTGELWSELRRTAEAAGRELDARASRPPPGGKP